MSVAIAVLITTWRVSDSHPGDDTCRVEEIDVGMAVNPTMVSTDQGYEIDALKGPFRDLNKTVWMLMGSITHLESNAIRTYVLSVTLNGEQKSTVV